MKQGRKATGRQDGRKDKPFVIGHIVPHPTYKERRKFKRFRPKHGTMAFNTHLKDLRDHEAHIGSIGVKYGFNGNDAKHEINELIETIFSYLDKFRLVFLSTLIFAESLKEGGPFPIKSRVVLSKSGMYIFEVPGHKKYMSFIVGKGNAIDSIPTKFIKNFKNGIVVIETEANSILTINFPEDKITKENNCKIYLYNGGIYDRNSSSGFTKIT